MSNVWGYRVSDGEPIYQEDAAAMFDDMLEEVYGPVTIGGLEYAHGDTMREVDPIAYRVGLSDYWDSLMSDGEYVEDLEDEEDDDEE